MSTVVFKRRIDACQYDDLRPGEYWQIRRTFYHGSTIWLVWRCPTCNVLASLTRSAHSVDHDGNVHPTVGCYNKACQFNYAVQLDAWVPEGLASA